MCSWPKVARSLVTLEFRAFSRLWAAFQSSLALLYWFASWSTWSLSWASCFFAALKEGLGLASPGVAGMRSPATTAAPAVPTNQRLVLDMVMRFISTVATPLRPACAVVVRGVVTAQARDLDDVARVRRVHELATADVDADVAEPVEEDQ